MISAAKTFSFFLMFSLLVAQLSAAADSGPKIHSDSLTLNVQFKGLRNSKGKVLIRLFNTKEGFPDKAKEAVRYVSVEIQEGLIAKAQFSDLTPGPYAVAAIHDENESGEMETNWIGIPREGMGISRDATGFMGPPKFKDAVLNLNQSQEIEINFVYL